MYENLFSPQKLSVGSYTYDDVLHCIVCNGNNYVVCTLQNGDTPLHIASEEGNVAAIEALLKNGAVINQTNEVRKLHIIAIDLLFHLHNYI